MPWHQIGYVLWDVTWGNNIAWLESLAIGAIGIWLFRDHIGRHLVRWFHKHHLAHLAELEKERDRNEISGG